jgi:hypothetical protein
MTRSESSAQDETGANVDHERALDAMANAYSIRARQARVQQGLPPVITSPNALNRLATIMAAQEAASALCASREDDQVA